MTRLQVGRQTGIRLGRTNNQGCRERGPMWSRSTEWNQDLVSRCRRAKTNRCDFDSERDFSSFMRWGRVQVLSSWLADGGPSPCLLGSRDQRFGNSPKTVSSFHAHYARARVAVCSSGIVDAFHRLSWTTRGSELVKVVTCTKPRIKPRHVRVNIHNQSYHLWRLADFGKGRTSPNTEW